MEKFGIKGRLEMNASDCEAWGSRGQGKRENVLKINFQSPSEPLQIRINLEIEAARTLAKEILLGCLRAEGSMYEYSKLYEEYFPES